MKDPLTELVSRSQQGDRVALAELISRTQQRVYNLAYHLVGNAQEAEDLTQDVYLRMWRALPRFRGDSKFTTWLHRITKNVCLNRWRRLRRQFEIDEERLELIPASFGDPTEETIQQDERTRIWAAVDQLPEKYRLALILFYQQQLSYKEIADVLELPLGTIKTHLNRGRRSLAAILRRAKEKVDVEL